MKKMRKIVLGLIPLLLLTACLAVFCACDKKDVQNENVKETASVVLDAAREGPSRAAVTVLR